MKTCSKCCTEKELSEFWKQRSCKDGYKPECKACSKAYYARYRRENAKVVKFRNARWRRENREKVKAKDHRRRARKANAEGSYTAEELQTRLEFFGHRCIFCGTEDNLTVDHLTPLSRGGSNHPQNLAPACHSCNCRKGAKTAKEFFEYLATVQHAMHEGGGD